MPRRTHARKEAAAGERFQRTLARQLWSLDLPKGKRVRVWALDEHRYGLISHQRRCWGMRRVRPHARYRTKYEWGYVATALEIAGQGEGLCVFFPTVNQDVSARFLEQISRTDPDSLHVVIQDQAGFHLRSEDPERPANVFLLPLPPYSPELNPVERVGALLRSATANRVFADLAEMEAVITTALRPLWTDPARVRSLVGDGWLLAQVNAFSN